MEATGQLHAQAALTFTVFSVLSHFARTKLSYNLYGVFKAVFVTPSVWSNSLSERVAWYSGKSREWQAL